MALAVPCFGRAAFCWRARVRDPEVVRREIETLEGRLERKRARLERQTAAAEARRERMERTAAEDEEWSSRVDGLLRGLRED